MKRTKTKRALQALTLVLLSALLYCCTDEQSFSGPGNGDEKTIVFSVKVPGNSTPKTRALLGDDENAVKQIAVLLFDEKGYTYHPIYSNTITDTGNGKKSFTLKVPEGTFNMVILANANASLNKALDGVKEGISKAELLKKITVTNEGKWNTDTKQANYMPIPMWGEIPTITVNSNTKNIDTSLLRMLSKIDVNLAQAAQANFNLQSVRLYNYNTVGQVVPDEANLNSDKSAVKSPSLTGSTTGGPLVYEGDAITKDDSKKGISCKNEIYAFEAAAGDPEKLKTNTCLVIGGVYKGNNNTTYYRVDLAHTDDDGTSTFLALLRNYQYQINIQDVKGPGVEKPEDALDARPVNITANVIEWSNSQFSDFVMDGQYLVGVSETEFKLSKEKRDASSLDNLLSVVTDYPKGWHIDVTDAEGKILGETSWLKCNPTKGTNIAGDDVRLLMGENNTEAERVAYIHVKAERLDYRIKVTQLNTANVGIHILVNDKENTMVDFISTLDDIKNNILPDPVRIDLLWSPASQNINCSSSLMGSNAFEFNTGDKLQALPGSGQLTGGKLQYYIQPKPISKEILDNDPFYQRSTVYIYTLTDGLTSLNKTITLRQAVYNVDPVLPSTFLMDGQQKSFGIRANTDFKVEVTDDPHHIVSNLKTSGAPDVSKNGTPVTFTIIDDLTNPSLYQKKVTLTIKSPTGKFPDTPITLTCVSGVVKDPSNSYLLKTNGVGVLIPVSRANKSSLGTQIKENDAFTAELVWTDNSKGVASDSNIKIVNTTGKGANGYVLVLPGSAPGNAVVAAKIGDKIIWSWHIWITSDEPQDIGGVMDRNLGATDKAVGSIGAGGLIYQWGRKDPFPGINASSQLNTMYDSKGTIIPFPSIAKSASTGTIDYVISNPSTYINSSGDWINNRTNDLWTETEKTIYDPCPEGWRVPNSDTWSGNEKLESVGGTYSGINIAVKGGWYPALGYYMNGKIDDVSKKGYSWTAGATGEFGLSFSLDTGSKSLQIKRNSFRAVAMPVRCIKE